MKQYKLILYAAVIFAAGVLLAGCGDIRKLSKSAPEVNMRQLVKSGQAVDVADTIRAQKIISFRKEDGTELFFAPATVDSLTGQKMMSVAIDEVVISASNRRNLVERNGKINVEFVVTVPEAFQGEKWQLTLHPQLKKGSDTLSFAPLVYSGSSFREMQLREYDRYHNYLDRIVDSTQYFDRFGDKKSYGRYMDIVADRHAEYNRKLRRLESLTPVEATSDKIAGWVTPHERRRQYALLRNYARSTTRKVARNTPYTPVPGDKFDHLNDYLTPRHRYGGQLPGGAIYTRVRGHYPDSMDRRREAYIQSLAESPKEINREVAVADAETLRRLAAERLTYTGFDRHTIEGVLRETSDSASRVNYRIQKQFAQDQLATLNSLDTNSLRNSTLRLDQVERNLRLAENRDAVFARTVRHPYLADARLDTIIHRVDGKIDYRYSELVPADENTSRLYLFLNGSVQDRNGRSYRLQKSDTLMYSVASMTTFLDESPRYMQRIVLRDAEANARFYFTFPAGKSTLDETELENRKQVLAVRELTRDLMTDPIYIIDSITLRATSSPEGTWTVNDRLARERAEVLRKVLVADFSGLYDSLKVAVNITLDDNGRVVMEKQGDDALPDLPNLLRTKWLAEDWAGLRGLVEADTLIANKQEVLAAMESERDPDQREWRIRTKYPKAYNRMRNVFYPQMRAVDFRFNLHRRGMQQDTIYTTEIDSNYMHAVGLLKKRRYEEALTILRAYDDRNTALAYMSLGYDAAAYRILRVEPRNEITADLQYMMAILSVRLGNEEQAVQHFLRAVELRENLKFRGNLDPEISRMIRKYGLFKEEF